MNTNKKVLTRNVTKEECPWLDEDVCKGDIVFIYTGPTYGCISSGIAVSSVENETPFFELPTDVLTNIEDVQHGSR